VFHRSLAVGGQFELHLAAEAAGVVCFAVNVEVGERRVYHRGCFCDPALGLFLSSRCLEAWMCRILQGERG
jgi:hypothetical protein